MLGSLPVTLLVGTALGFLTGLGIGGGSLLILWLTMVLDVQTSVARGINLLFFIPAAVIACVFRMKQGTLTIRKVIPAIISGCIAAACFSFLSTVLDVEILKKGFGVVLIAAGFREIFYKKREL